tara:strand:+ start:162 stop:857 length:696 start_codon:yes stop_codon:yes gene_type:complete
VSGVLFGLGMGPGDPELITLKAVRILSECPVVAYPAPEEGKSFVRGIANSFIKKSCVEIVIRTPMVAGKFPANDIYDFYASEIRNYLEKGQNVAVLCEGDPFLYGSFSYIFLRLANEFNTEVVPGVSSLCACSAAAKTPLVLRNQALSIVPATLSREELMAKILLGEPTAIMKIGRHLKKVRGLLTDMELDESAYYVEHASMKTQKVMKLSKTEGLEAPYFSMVLVCLRNP